MSEIKSICVYCGSSTGNNPAYREAGLALGRSLAEHKIRLVYGGGTKGIMGAVAEGVMQNGGKVLGIIPEFLIAKEASDAGITHLNEVIVTKDMHERKHLMFQHSDAFVTLPGGIGTVEEIVKTECQWQGQRNPRQATMADGQQNNSSSGKTNGNPLRFVQTLIQKQACQQHIQQRIDIIAQR